MKRIPKISIIVLLLFTLYSTNIAFGWYDETHLAVAKASGYSKWYNAAGADITKIKANRIEGNNHFFNNNDNVEVTPEMVLEQAKRYNDPDDSEGHLYGAIIASLRDYTETTKKDKYAEYHLAFCAHYVADLSQPLHNTPYDDFNKIHHLTNDGIVDDGILKNISKIEKYMYPINLRPDNFEKDLAKEIARIANDARQLGFKLRKENRDMTREEAYRQLGHSASLLRAILVYLGQLEKPDKLGRKKQEY
jgi:hypothetical protein